MNTKLTKALSGLMVIVLCLTFILPRQALAARSHAGGGELAEMNWGMWAATQVMSIGASFVGNSVAGELFGGQGFSGYFDMSNNALLSGSGFFGQMANFTVMHNIGFATGELSAACMNSGMDPRAALFASSLLGGIVGGALNPGSALGINFTNSIDVSTTVVGGQTVWASAGLYSTSGILNGMALGAVEGAVKGAVLAGLADEKGKLPFWAGPVAGLAGNFASNLLVGGFSQSMLDPRTGNDAVFTRTFSFGNTPDLSQAFTYSMQQLIRDLPSTAWSIGVNAITEDMKPQERQLVQSALGFFNPTMQGLGGALVSTPAITSIFPIEVITNMDIAEARRREALGLDPIPHGSIMRRPRE